MSGDLGSFLCERVSLTKWRMLHGVARSGGAIRRVDLALTPLNGVLWQLRTRLKASKDALSTKRERGYGRGSFPVALHGEHELS